MKKKKAIIVITQIFLIFTLIFVGSLSKFNSVVIPLSAVNENNHSTLNTSSWFNATVISDINNWNIDESLDPSIAVDNNGNIHVVWEDYTNGEWGTDSEIMYANYTSAGWSNATVISDIYGWNNEPSLAPSIAVDNNSNLHVVWEDDTDGEWGTDSEIMYANYTSVGWSNATVISDIYGWNDQDSRFTSIVVDNNSNIHVVWSDDTDGEWGGDWEIMYANNTGAGWSNATVISDIYGWNNDDSSSPSIAIDNNGNLHVVWEDSTAGEWGTDQEIMYANYTGASWSNATVISDIYGWNDDDSSSPSIAVANDNNLHVVWEDGTNGTWGIDIEIMYANYTSAGWSNATVISDIYGWNNDLSLAPSIVVDKNGKIHVVWSDDTDGEWGTDQEIMYVNYTSAVWSNATAISDIYGWNSGLSGSPSIIAENNGRVHIVWEDGTDAEWGTDSEIMYTTSDKKPTSTQPTDITTSASGTETINWTLSDDFGTGQYRVLANDTNDNYYVWVDWASWTNNTQYNITINRTAPGIYNYTIQFNDSYNQLNTDIVIVNITDALPTTNQPSDINTTTTSSETINWTLFDDFGSGYYRIWVNDTNDNYYVWINWTTWPNATPLNIAINRSTIGLFNYTIEFNTTTGQVLTDTVFVNITRGPSPSEPSLLPLLLLLIPKEDNLPLITLVMVLVAVGSFIGLILIRRLQER